MEPSTVQSSEPNEGGKIKTRSRSRSVRGRTPQKSSAPQKRSTKNVSESLNKSSNRNTERETSPFRLLNDDITRDERHSQNDGIEVNVPPGEDNFDSEVEGDSESDPDRSVSMVSSDESDQDTSEVTFNKAKKKTKASPWANHKSLKERLSSDPEIKSLLGELVAEGVEDEMKRRSIGSPVVSTPTRQRHGSGEARHSDGRGIVNQAHKPSDRNVPQVSHIKSPSDTTIYTPALKRGGNGNKIIQRISNLVESMQLDEEERSGTRHHGEIGVLQHDPDHQDGMEEEPQPSTREVTDKIVIAAEKFKASVTPPKGMLDFSEDELRDLRKNDNNDDEFFHVTCHIDQNLKDRIGRGEFIELEKLLPKDRCGGAIMFREEKRLELVHKDGSTYYQPIQEQKINGVRKWEQAFRIYAAIYTQANLSQASEIWQYIYCINAAAQSFPWDSVAYYDFTFRHLMAAKPWRNWVKTYTHGWNLALRDDNAHKQTPGRQPLGHSHDKPRDWKDDCCWRFNRNHCKMDNQCKFDHRCTYCGGWGYGYFNCRKHNKGGNDSDTAGAGEWSAPPALAGTSADGSKKNLKKKNY